MKKNELFRAFVCSALLIFSNLSIRAQAYKISSNTMVANPTFNGNPTGTTVPSWTFSPTGKWNKENNLIYGEDIVIDALGSFSATPALTATPCLNAPKVIRFDYNEENTGPYSFNIKLGGVTVASFSQSGLNAQSAITVGTGNTMQLDRKFLSEGSWSFTTPIWNNIWHQVEIYVPGYTSGDLTFEYVRNGGISRKVRVDNVNLFEAIPTPQVSGSVTITPPATYDLTTQQPKNASYTYKWYTSTDPVTANAVSTPTAVSIGTYYLFATPVASCGNNTTNVSYGSGGFTVNGTGCGLTNLITNGDFQSAAIPNYPGWTAINGSGNIGTVNGTNYTTYQNTINGEPWKTPPTAADNWMKMYSGTSATGISQSISSLCAYDPKRLDFDLVIDEESIGNYSLTVSIGSSIIFVITPNPNSPWDFRFTTISPGVTITATREDGTVFTGSQLTSAGNLFQYSGNGTLGWRYHIRADIGGSTAQSIAAGSTLTFNAQAYNRYFLDNISLTNLAPVGDNPSSTTASVNCSTGVFNLTTLQPTNIPSHSYEWYDSANNKVSDATKAPQGTYYMKTISTCSGCATMGTVAVTVNNSACVSISGKIFADYDGAPNGVSTTSAVGQSAGMYAMLVNSSGNVVAFTKVNSDGTYTITSATSAASNYVKISTTQPAVGSAAPAYTTLTPNYVYTSASAIGSTNYAAGANGTGTSPLLGSATSVSGVNFGLNSPPVASDEGGEQCALAANTAFTVPAIYGVDDDPTWRDDNTANGENGTLQKINIKSLNQTNGVLTYNGTPVTATTVIPSYNPALLVFTSGTAGASSFNFTYTFIDAANAESREVGTVSYSFVPNPTISGISTVAVGGTRNLTGSITPGTVPTAWTSSNPAIATVDNNGVVTGVAVGTTTITYTDYIGCSGTMTVNVIAAACIKPATIDAGNTYPSKTAVTILTHPTADNWLNMRQSAHIVMEGNSYGFVPNRVANPETTITVPKIGMMVYDTTAKCLKVNMDGTSTGWKCLTTQTCPN